MAAETLALKRRLVELLEGNENANEALRRHRGSQAIEQKKKNVRKAVLVGETTKPQKSQVFEELLAVTTRL